MFQTADNSSVKNTLEVNFEARKASVVLMKFIPADGTSTVFVNVIEIETYTKKGNMLLLSMFSLCVKTIAILFALQPCSLSL